MHRQSYRPRPRVCGKIWLECGGRFVLGDGGVRLLRAIQASGSVRSAARSVGWSYRHALAYLDNAESALGVALVDRKRGGNERGGAALTAGGREFVARYRRLRAALNVALQRMDG